MENLNAPSLPALLLARLMILVNASSLSINQIGIRAGKTPVWSHRVIGVMGKTPPTLAEMDLVCRALNATGLDLLDPVFVLDDLQLFKRIKKAGAAGLDLPLSASLTRLEAQFLISVELGDGLPHAKITDLGMTCGTTGLCVSNGAAHIRKLSPEQLLSLPDWAQNLDLWESSDSEIAGKVDRSRARVAQVRGQIEDMAGVQQ